MNYEQKYKEVLQKAKEEYNRLGELGNESMKRRFEIIFPELAESEDERIRTRLSEYFRGFLEGNEHCYKDGGYVKWEGLDVKSILDWLEKQKEQKPDLELIQRSWYMDGYIDGEFKREPRWNLKAGKGGPKYEENEKYGQPLEQKSAEWGEEDEDMLNSCISSIEEAKENRYAYKETDGDTSYDHEIAWLKSLRPKRVNVSDQTLQLLICYLYGCHDVAKRDGEKADCRRYISYLEDLLKVL